MSTAIAAPSAAPDAVPSTYGSASGLRSRPWNVAPATARPTPTTIAVRTRGRRRSQTIVSVAGDQVRPRSSPSSRSARIAERVGRRDRDRAEPDAEHERDDEGDEPADAEEDRTPTGAPDPGRRSVAGTRARRRSSRCASAVVGSRDGARRRRPATARPGSPRPGGSPAASARRPVDQPRARVG